jgi:alpha-D-ribose 1-methylphosphonate 5-triphosphate synthase subunit PhnL
MGATDATLLELTGVTKTFVLHLRGGTLLPVLREVSFQVHAGECVVLNGPSGIGKSCILKMIFGNYRADCGSISVREGRQWRDIVTSSPREVLRLRQGMIGYVSQFLRTIPRVGALDLVVQSARDNGIEAEVARERAAELLARLAIPERLWPLPPATFSGGEQQRINIARGLVARHPLLLLDEPTASLDQKNRAAVVEFIRHRKRTGAALVGIFHDEDVKRQIADRSIEVSRFRA